MGWTCQYDYKGYCKRVEKPCVPGMNGCILKSSDHIFSGEHYQTPEKEGSEREEIDFAALARSH